MNLLFKLFTVILILLNTCGYVFSQTEQINQLDSKGLNQGLWIFKYDNGNVKEEIIFKDSVRNGIYKANDYEGTLRVLGEYSNGKKNGSWKTFYSDGQLFTEINYSDGIRTGIFKSYYQLEDAKVLKDKQPTPEEIPIKSIGFYKNNNKSGDWKQFYQSGNIKLESHFNNGLLHGKWINYYKNGQIKTKGKYKKSDLHGRYIDYLENGQILNTSKYRWGKLNGRCEKYTFDGKLKIIRNYKNDKLHGKYISYYTDTPNQQISESKSYRFGEINGIMKIYRKNGWMIAKVLYKNGKMTQRIDAPPDVWDDEKK